jgi:predicted metal-dependent hydrolase
VQLDLPFRLKPASAPSGDWLVVGARLVRVCLVRHPRARRYILRLRAGGVARVTIPRGGSAAEGRAFAERNTGWLADQLQRQATRPAGPKPWMIGTEILFRGVLVKLEAGVNGAAGCVCFAGEKVKVAESAVKLRPQIERHLWRLAARELPARVFELAEQHDFAVRRVTVRNQRSRWGSCSRRGTVSLNWRLVQAPAFVRDYIVLHELAHIKEMNHSPRFWNEVARLCPGFAEAERWLKEHQAVLR